MKKIALTLGLFFFAASGFLVGSASKQGVIDYGKQIEPFFGVHQSGIETQPQSHVTLIAFDIHKGVDQEAMGRLMRVWTSDAAVLTKGEAIISDSQPEMAKNPARLTVTFGFGQSLFKKLRISEKWPLKVDEIPAFPIDKLEKRWSGGDLLIQVAGDDPQSIFHAVHELSRSAAPFAKIIWQQRGFLNSPGVNEGNSARTLLGQVDDQANAKPGTPDFDNNAWSTSPTHFVEGTTMVVRRIVMNFGTWDRLSAKRKSEVIGRTLKDGTPLSGGTPNSPLDLNKKIDGAPAIGLSAHARVAHTSSSEGIIRRGFNFDDGYTSQGVHDAGMIFISFQKDVDSYIKIQSALAEIDELNKWITHTGSALFVIPAGVQKGDWVGQSFFS